MDYKDVCPTLLVLINTLNFVALNLRGRKRA